MTPAERENSIMLLWIHLQRISDLWAYTAWAPARTERTMRPAPGPRSPANDAAIATRDDTRETLTYYARRIAYWQNLNPDLDTADVPAVCRWLQIHVEHLPDLEGGTAERDLATLRRRLGEVADTARRPRVHRLGHACPVEGCGAPLLGIVREGHPADVRCAAPTAHAWPRERWEHLGLTLTANTHRAEWDSLAVAVATRGDTDSDQDA